MMHLLLPYGLLMNCHIGATPERTLSAIGSGSGGGKTIHFAQQVDQYRAWKRFGDQGYNRQPQPCGNNPASP